MTSRSNRRVGGRIVVGRPEGSPFESLRANGLEEAYHCSVAKAFYVYMLRCRDGTYYVGHTDDLEKHLDDHYHGAVPGYTKSRRPFSLVWSAETETRYEALSFELQVKGWSRAKKEALIANDWDLISILALRRIPQKPALQIEKRPVQSVRPEALEG